MDSEGTGKTTEGASYTGLIIHDDAGKDAGILYFRG